MTAYGRCVSPDFEGMRVVIEIHSVNRKGLDIRLHTPREFLFLDLELRKIIKDALLRGQVTVRISTEEEKEKKGSLALLKKLKSNWEEKADALGYAKEAISLPFLIQQMERSTFEGSKNENAIKELIFQTTQKALVQFLEMKESEGQALDDDIKTRLKTLAQIVDEIEMLSKDSGAIAREKLLKRLEEILPDAAKDERVAKEVALMGEKLDITEEIIRMRSHLKQTEALFTSKEKSIGRSLDFLVQEMGREINTIGSKSGQIEVTKQTLLAKQELEKIREQAQNIE